MTSDEEARVDDLMALDVARAVSMAGAALLVVAAVAKVRAPALTADLLRRLHLPSGSGAVRALAALEILVAGLAVRGGIFVLPLALTYLVFAAVAGRVLHTSPDQACGCFGGSGAPLTAGHVALTLLLAGAGVMSVWGRPAWTLLSSDAVSAALLSVQVVLLTALGYALLVVYPPLVVVSRKVSS